MRAALFVSVLALGICPLRSTSAQSPAPIVVEAATPPPAGPAAAAAVPPNATADSDTMMQLLQEMRATNEATLKKQEAALEALDALEKAAEEIKIYGKRG
jgi:hypothetical protein